MATLTAICDDCGKEIGKGEIYPDYDGIDRCKKCNLKSKLYSIEEERKEKLEWLKITHIKELREMRIQIAQIKSDISAL